ncbi:MAG: hypothetical protein IMW89_16845 [Ktedonobacteraceae bacterium]|nr:hypothetical protein [Ktedonobacteraceae bacterium]
MNCERCGNELPGNTTVCPVCGSVNPQASSQPATSYGPPGQPNFGIPSLPQQNYTQPAYYQQPISRQPVPPPLKEQAGFYRLYQSPPYYSAGPVNPPLSGNFQFTRRNNSALITELLLSLFGIFGVGWLMAGETVIGVILLLASVLIYWPVILLGTVITDGFALICLGPVAVGMIILNVMLLQRTLNRKAARSTTPPPRWHMPPRSE